MDNTDNLKLEMLKQIADNIQPRHYPAYKENDILGNAEACAVLHCQLRTLDEYVSSKGLPYHKAGRARLFIYGEIVDWVKSRPGSTDRKTPERKPKSITSMLRGSGRKKEKPTKKAI